jgi:hypothetical protein
VVCCFSGTSSCLSHQSLLVVCCGCPCETPPQLHDRCHFFVRVPAMRCGEIQPGSWRQCVQSVCSMSPGSLQCAARKPSRVLHVSAWQVQVGLLVFSRYAVNRRRVAGDWVCQVLQCQCTVIGCGPCGCWWDVQPSRRCPICGRVPPMSWCVVQRWLVRVAAVVVFPDLAVIAQTL